MQNFNYNLLSPDSGTPYSITHILILRFDNSYPSKEKHPRNIPISMPHPFHLSALGNIICWNISLCISNVAIDLCGCGSSSSIQWIVPLTHTGYGRFVILLKEGMFLIFQEFVLCIDLDPYWDSNLSSLCFNVRAQTITSSTKGSKPNSRLKQHGFRLKDLFCINHCFWIAFGDGFKITDI